MSERRGDGESGYALIAAVASIAVFAAMSLAILSATRAAIVTGGAEIGQAQAAAAADAGVALGLSGLLSDDIADRWSIDGRVHALRFGDAQLRVRIEDERGKVPLDLLDEDRATRLLTAIGLDGDRLKIARDSLLDWTDDDDDVRPFGAESAYYAPLGIRPRDGAPRSIGELRRVRGFDAGLVARLAPIVTIDFGHASFDPRYADPVAIEVMAAGSGGDAAAAIERRREIAGERVALDAGGQSDLTGRPLTVAVDATVPGGGHATRRAIVELTGSAARPYVVRSYD